MWILEQIYRRRELRGLGFVGLVCIVRVKASSVLSPAVLRSTSGRAVPVRQEWRHGSPLPCWRPGAVHGQPVCGRWHQWATWPLQGCPSLSYFCRLSTSSPGVCATQFLSDVALSLLWHCWSMKGFPILFLPVRWERGKGFSFRFILTVIGSYHLFCLNRKWLSVQV